MGGCELTSLQITYIFQVIIFSLAIIHSQIIKIYAISIVSNQYSICLFTNIAAILSINNKFNIIILHVLK